MPGRASWIAKLGGVVPIWFDAPPSRPVGAIGMTADIEWGSRGLQRLRLYPLYIALRAADRLARPWAQSALPPAPAWKPGVTVVIPERDAPTLLAQALASVRASLAVLGEPAQIVVVANGAPRERYAALAREAGEIEWIHRETPLGFSQAVLKGVARARYDWTFLMNNDVVVAREALPALAAQRAGDVFAIGAQIDQRSANGRREETGFTDWYVDASGIRLYHAQPMDNGVRSMLCASGGATLFHTATLLRFVGDARAYDPFYWEDAEWSVRAWREGREVRFCPLAHASHRHRATTGRFYSAEEIERIVERNRMLFDARNAASDEPAATLMRRICGLPYASQRDLARPSVALGVFRRRLTARRSSGPLPPPRLVPSTQDGVAIVASRSYSYTMRAAAGRAPERPRAIVVSPFAVYPPKHGGARRSAGLIDGLRDDFDIVLLSDEASLYNPLSFAHFEGLSGVELVERPRVPDASVDFGERVRRHCHAGLRNALRGAITRHRPAVVHVEHAELASLVAERAPGPRWVLGLHDAVHASDFAQAMDARDFAGQVARYDAVTVCSAEDAALVQHPRTVCVPNGTSLALADYRPSTSSRLLFLGPFRYRPNLDGIRTFLRDVWPAIRAEVPSASVRILGGDGAPALAASDPLFAQDGVEVMAHRDDVAEQLAQCAATLNPLTGIRGSALKLVESLTAGRICISTEEGARGFLDQGLAALVTVSDVAAMAAPAIALLSDPKRRQLQEVPDAAVLGRYQWGTLAKLQRDLWQSLLRQAPGSGQ